MSQDFGDILRSEYDYSLPESKIALFPLEKRDEARLLFYNQSQIEHRVFKEIPDILPEDTLLVLNDTRVIPARFYFKRASGAQIEIFLLEPHLPNQMPLMMSQKGQCQWRCLIGNKKKWKDGEVLLALLVHAGQSIELRASLLDREEQLVELNWSAPLSFMEISQIFGQLPLPPYLKRAVEEKDQQSYQTTYSEKKGAVAAPTAGLHFTEQTFADLEKKGISRAFLTLHVGGGTFQPIKHDRVKEHPMHNEQILFNQDFLHQLSVHSGPVIPVGTTSMRALESLYWFGQMIKQCPRQDWGQLVFKVEKLYPYQIDSPITRTEALDWVLEFKTRFPDRDLFGETEIFIFPSYDFKICRGLVTNFHLPQTTLLLLVAALIGEDWKRVYQEALEKPYRFLSYGDSSFLLP